MKRIIIDYHNLTPELFQTIKRLYPDGYSDEDMIVFKNAKNETVKAIEVKHEDTDYLVKISKQLAVHLEDMDDVDIPDIEIPDDPIID